MAQWNVEYNCDSQSSASDCEFSNENGEDLSYSHLETIPESTLARCNELVSLQLNNNAIVKLPKTLGSFSKLVTLDISNNDTKTLCDELCHLRHLRTLLARNNNLSTEALPKDFGLLQSLEVLNLSGNLFTNLSPQITELSRLRCLYLGGNRLQRLSSHVQRLHSLEVLYLGGNRLVDIPAEVGHLQHLQALNLADNRLQTLPPTFMSLHSLKSLNLHNNCLQTLPPEIVSLNLVELSLRKNPLVNRFVQDLVYEPPSLLEMAGRMIKVEKVRYTQDDLPLHLIRYLDSASSCVNPKCKGVYFSSKVEHVKFVDFCGKYRLPLMQYLCSPSCSDTQPSHRCDHENCECNTPMDEARFRMQRVLLG